MKRLKILSTINVLPSTFSNKKGRWFRSLYLGLLVLMVIALIVAGVSIWGNISQQFNEKLAPQTRSLTEVMSRFLASQKKTLLAISEGFDMETVHSKPAQDILYSMTAATRQMKAVAVIDVRNNILIASGDYQSGDWGHLFPKKSSNLSQVGIPFRMSLFGESFIPIRVPIFDSSNQLAGYLAAAYQIIGHDGIWTKSGIDLEHMTVTLASNRGLIYATVPEEEESFLQSFATVKLAPQLLNEIAQVIDDEIRVGKVDTSRGAIIFSTQKVQHFNGYVIVSVLTKKLWGLWFSQMKYAALIILCGALLGLLVLRISIRRAHVFEEEKYQAQNNVSKLSQAIEQSPSSVIVTDGSWITEYANKKLKDGSGQLIDIQMNVMLMNFFPHDLLLPDLEKINVALNLGDNWYCERSVDHEQQWFSFSISKMTEEGGSEENHIVITQNITERKKAETRLYNQAYFDSLTGLPNRRNSSVLLKKSINQAREMQAKIALVYLDLDNFKQVNDRYGHAVGDQLLQAVAQRLDLVMRTVGTACHMSGDEFLVFLEYQGREDIINVIQRLIDSVTSPIDIEGRKMFVTVSMGVSCFPQDSSDVNSMLKHADIALYCSKESGRNCYSFFDAELEAKSKRRSDVETEIRHALKNDELYMVYQTKNNISDYTVSSFEALMRWNSSVLGFVGPDEFIIAAETIGVIDKMGEFALYQACKDLKEFQKRYDRPLTMAVNLSMRQLNNNDIVGIVRNVLAAEMIDPKCLELEITESLLAERFDIVLPILNELIALGVSLSIDDFGTGYSSLNYLTKFPVSTLKVDRSFIVNMVLSDEDAALVDSVIAMAHRLGLKVVAEGIEAKSEIEMLQKFNCDIGQGYYYSKPLKEADMLKLLSKLQIEQLSPALGKTDSKAAISLQIES